MPAENETSLKRRYDDTLSRLEQSVSELVQHVEPFRSWLADVGPVKRAIEEANKTLASRAGSNFPTKYADSGGSRGTDKVVAGQ